MTFSKNNPPSRGHLLITGSTGLLGRYLLKDLLLAGLPIATIVRPARRQSAADRMEAIMQTWEQKLGRRLPRPYVLEGDLSDELLGLDPESTAWVAENCQAVLHNAASLSFINGPRTSEPWRTNLTGTQHLLNLCEKVGIAEFHHVSTAYVCGTRQGRVYENELDEGQQLSNDYEQSKFEAEHLVRSAEFLNSTTIYRPSIIVGDSETGFSTTFHGFYVALQLAHTLRQGWEELYGDDDSACFRINLDGTELKNLVPVDWISSVINEIVNNSNLHNQTYHLTSDTPVSTDTIHKVLDACCDNQGVTRLIGAKTVIENPNDVEKLFYENMQVYGSYWKNDPEFDCTNTRTAAPHLPCPVMDEDRLMMLGKAAIAQDFRWRDKPVDTRAGVTG